MIHASEAVDELMEFLLTRDRGKVAAEASPVPLEQLYAEAPETVRGVIDVMPIGALRRKLAVAEAELGAMREARKVSVRVVGPDQIVAEMKRAQRKIRELEEINQDQARLLAQQRERKSA